MTHILWLIPVEYVVSSWLKYQSIPSYYGYGIENGTTTATGSESFFNKILVWLVLNMRWNSKRSSYQWIIYLNHTYLSKKSYQKVSGQTALINCTHNLQRDCTLLTCYTATLSAINRRYFMISDSMESPLAIKYQPRLYGQAASYQKLADGRSHIQGFTSGPENGRSMGLKVKGPKTYDSQSGEP